MNNQHSSPFNFSVLDENHAEPIRPTFSTSTDPIPELASKPSQSSHRSREAITRRNKKRHQKLNIKRQQHKIKRKIHHQWTMIQIKQYLDLLHIKHARILPIYKKILRLQFNNQHDQDFADEQLGIDVFNENHYQEFVNKNH